MSTQALQVVDFQQSLVALESTQKLCHALIKTPHYARMGQEGIFAIVAKARSLSIDPLDALNGGLYCVQGRVEMSAQMMNQLIRMHGHSVTKDSKSDDSICILHGKRADTNDTWTESFSINEAKRAGIYSEKSAWGKYPRDMLFARALSRLARQLFPDVIKGCYVEGELSAALATENVPGQPINDNKENKTLEIKETLITQKEIEELEEMFALIPEYRTQVLTFLKNSFQVDSLDKLPSKLYDRVRSGAVKKLAELEAVGQKQQNWEGDYEEQYAEAEEA